MIGVVCAIAILSAGCKSKESEAPTLHPHRMYLQKLPKQNISRNRWKPTKEKSEVSIRESGWMKKKQRIVRLPS